MTSKTQGFIRRAQAKHGDRYDYSLAVYTKSTCKVTIICRVHGPFEQRAAGHMMGNGCRKCADLLLVERLKGNTYRKGSQGMKYRKVPLEVPAESDDPSANAMRARFLKILDDRKIKYVIEK